MKNGWTGGQYSVIRMAFGAYLAICFVMLPVRGSTVRALEWIGSPSAQILLLGTGTACSLLLAVGWGDRVAALIICVLFAILWAGAPTLLNLFLPFASVLLLWHAMIPGSPYLSLQARGRIDPAGAWRLPPSLFAALWIVTSAGYFCHGVTTLLNHAWVHGTALQAIPAPHTIQVLLVWLTLGLELLYPFAYFPRARPIIWSAMLLLHLTMLGLGDTTVPRSVMVFVQLFAFDPAWIHPTREGATETIYYDGTCGLCHRAVRFLLAEDRSGETFAYAPLGGETFARRVNDEGAKDLPDSVIVDASGVLLVRSAAVVHVLERLGGGWRILGAASRVVPRWLADLTYDAVAAVRYRLFARPKDACPILPSELRSRFLP